MFRTAPLAEMGNVGRWEIVGFVNVDEEGVQDPFSEPYRAIVRPRACRMGGEAVTIMISAVDEVGMGTRRTAISYAVLRERRQAPSAPEKF